MKLESRLASGTSVCCDFVGRCYLLVYSSMYLCFDVGNSFFQISMLKEMDYKVQRFMSKDLLIVGQVLEPIWESLEESTALVAELFQISP